MKLIKLVSGQKVISKLVETDQKKSKSFFSTSSHKMETVRLAFLNQKQIISPKQKMSS